MAKKSANKDETVGTVKVTLVRSPIGTMERHRQCLVGLGLRRMHQTVELQDTPSVRGIINKISYMLQVEG